MIYVCHDYEAALHSSRCTDSCAQHLAHFTPSRPGSGAPMSTRLEPWQALELMVSAGFCPSAASLALIAADWEVEPATEILLQELLHSGRSVVSVQELEDGENMEEKDSDVKVEEKNAPAECRVVVLRLTRRARTPEVQRLLFESPMLANQRARVVNANCEVRAAMPCLAKIFVPYADKLIQDLKEAGVELKDHHILCWESDIHYVQSALRELPCSKRPLLSQVYPASVSSRA